MVVFAFWVKVRVRVFAVVEVRVWGWGPDCVTVSPYKGRTTRVCV